MAKAMQWSSTFCVAMREEHCVLGLIVWDKKRRDPVVHGRHEEEITPSVAVGRRRRLEDQRRHCISHELQLP